MKLYLIEMCPFTSFSQMYDTAIHFPKNKPVFLKLSATLNDTSRLILFTVWGESSVSVPWTSQHGMEAIVRPVPTASHICSAKTDLPYSR